MEVERPNSAGVSPDELDFVLRDRRMVWMARRINACLLCRRPGVNEAGLCDICYALLGEELFTLAGRWLTGQGP